MLEANSSRVFPIIVGTGYGDEGKGTVVDFLCSESPIDYVVRFSGGPQTAHNVVTVDGRQHTFSLFGSGTLQGAGTILSEFVLVNPFNMILEANELIKHTGKDPLTNTYISENALLITPVHVEANHQREINRGANAHGSCGEGIGETRAYALYQTPKDPIRIKDMLDPAGLKKKLQALREFLETDVENFISEIDIDEIVDGYSRAMRDRPFNIVPDDFITALIADETLSFIFEGSQGILLDEAFGFHPHTTWSDVTDAKARLLLERAGVKPEQTHRIGITRTYATRHGYGPFPSEYPDSDLTKRQFPEHHNTWGRFQGGWRVGALDLSLLDYAQRVNGGFDSIALTHCDIQVEEVVHGWEKEIEHVTSVDLVHQENITNMLNSFKEPDIVFLNTRDPIGTLIDVLESKLGTPVSILSYGPTAEDKKRV